MPLPTLPSTSVATPATAAAAGRPASQRATAQSAPHAAPREGRSTAAQARAPPLTTSSGPAPAPPPVTTRPALAVDRAPPPPRTKSTAPTPFPDRNRAPLHTARSWTAWFHRPHDVAAAPQQRWRRLDADLLVAVLRAACGGRVRHQVPVHADERVRQPDH